MARRASHIAKRFRDPGWGLRAYLHIRWRLCPFDRVLPLIPESGRLLDVGCGSGLWLTYLALERPELRLEGIDPDPRKLALAATSEAEIHALHAGDAADIPDGPFDCITIIDVLYLMPDAEKARVLGACFRALHPGGRLVVKELDTKPLWKLIPSRVQELVAVRLVNLTHGDRLHFQPIEALVEAVEAEGFVDAEVLRVDRGYLHPHVVVQALRPV